MDTHTGLFLHAGSRSYSFWNGLSLFLWVVLSQQVCVCVCVCVCVYKVDMAMFASGLSVSIRSSLGQDSDGHVLFFYSKTSFII